LTNLTEDCVRCRQPFKVSICIPTYNAPEFFRRVMQSIVIQDYTDFEVIVTDDSQNDCIRDVLSDFSFAGTLTYIKNSKQLGAPGNWNRGIEIAKGKYIKILHHDDWLLTSESLGFFVDMMEKNPLASFGFSSAEAYDQEHRFKFIHTLPESRINDLAIDCNTLFLGNFIGPPSSIIFKNTPGLRFDENLQWLVDIDFYIQLLRLNNFFISCQDPLVGVTVESSHQVTRGCENNKQVELYEHLYLFSKLSHKRRHFFEHIKTFSQLFKKFSISSFHELTLLAPDVDIPWYIGLLAQIPRRPLKRA